MKQSYTYFTFLLFVVLLSACSGSNRMYKKGQELESAGLHEQAAMAYMDALRRDDDNIEALIALQNSARIVVDEKYGQFFRAIQEGDDRMAIQSYRDAESFRQLLTRYNVEIARPSGHEEDYNMAVERYLAVRYQEGRGALGAKDYARAESIFREMHDLREDYKDIENLLRLSQAQPQYNLAVEEFDKRNYREAYRLFDQLENRHGSFENSTEYKATSLRNGQFGLGLMEFQNHTDHGGVEVLLASRVTRILQAKNDPFLRLIDRTMIGQLTEEQIRAMSGQSDPTTAAEAGKLLGARAILVGELVSMSVDKDETRRTRRPGYLGREVTRTNSEGERVTSMVYDKVWYYDIERSSRVSAIFQYKMVDVETGEILLTNALNISESDQVSYSEYNGNTRHLYMGEWGNINEARPGDRVLRDSQSKRRLDNRLSSRQNLKSVEDLKNNLFNRMAESVAGEVYTTYQNIEG